MLRNLRTNITYLMTVLPNHVSLILPAPSICQMTENASLIKCMLVKREFNRFKDKSLPLNTGIQTT